MIYTGYFAQLKKYQEAGLTPVSIARITPSWYQGYVIPELAPSKSLLYRYKAGEVTQDAYIKEYTQQLDHMRWGGLMKKLKTYGDDVVLLCYEKSSDFCHRHILAEYLTESWQPVREYQIHKK